MMLNRVGIKDSWFVNHESISWSHAPKISRIVFFCCISRVKWMRLIDEEKIIKCFALF